jgi:hypothetical protein
MTLFLFIFSTILFSTAIRSWSPPILQEVCDNIFDSVSELFSSEKRSSSSKRQPQMSSSQLHPDVYSHIKRNELYFYSPEAKKRRMHRFLFSVSFVVVAVTAIGASASFLSWKKT